MRSRLLCAPLRSHRPKSFSFVGNLASHAILLTAQEVIIFLLVGQEHIKDV